MNLVEIAAGLLDGNDCGMTSKLDACFRVDIGGGSRRNVVQDHRGIVLGGEITHQAKVLQQTFLGRIVVIATDVEKSIDPAFGKNGAAEIDGLGGAVGTGEAMMWISRL